jgi:hypothetical protein
VREIAARLRFLNDVGLDYLSLDRSADTLSGGEAQRIRLASQIGSGLTGVMYVLDEPSIGLHQRDNAAARHAEAPARPRQHRDRGRARRGGDPRRRPRRRHGPRRRRARRARSSRRARPPRRSATPTSLTGRTCPGAARSRCRARARGRTHWLLRIVGARGNNLKDVDVEFPVGLFTCVTGVSGSGKSTLINDTLYAGGRAQALRRRAEPAPHAAIEGLEHFDKVIDVDQSPIGRTPRSNPATYTGLFTPIRELFAEVPEARERGYGAGPLQLQRQGRPLRGLPGRRRDQGRDALPARRLRALRRLPRQALQPRDARGPLQGQEHRRGARDDRRGRAPSSSRRSRRSRASCRRCSTSASATSASARARPRCPAARRSASSSRASCPSATPAARSTSSTSRPPGLHFHDIELLLKVLHRCATPATRSSSSSTTSTSSRPPTG